MIETSEILVRAGVEDDLTALTDIYNHYVRETAVSFDTDPFTPAERRDWLLSHSEDGPHRLLVARRHQTDGQGDGTGGTASGQILGYATSGPFRTRPAYATSVEVSVYLAPGAGGQGLGTLLYEHLFKALASQDLHRAYAGITVPNDASVRLHQRFGFELVGTYREAGRKFGRYHDVQRYEKPLGP